jgi:hypothetical protein
VVVTQEGRCVMRKSRMYWTIVDKCDMCGQSIYRELVLSIVQITAFHRAKKRPALKIRPKRGKAKEEKRLTKTIMLCIDNETL